MLAADHILALSKSKVARDGGRPDALVEAAHGKGYSLRRLAREVSKKLGRKIHPSRLSMARREERSINPDIAEAIEEIIGFAATKRNWPGGFTEGLKPPTTHRPTKTN